MPPSNDRLRILGGDVGGNGNHVLLGKTGYDRFHKLHVVSAAHPRLNIVELAHNVDRRAAGDARGNGGASQRVTVASSARRSVAGLPFPDELFTFGNAADWNIRCESRVGIVAARPYRFLRDFDDPIAPKVPPCRLEKAGGDA